MVAVKLFRRGQAKGKPAPITRAGRVIDDARREVAKKPAKVVDINDKRSKNQGGKK